MSIIYASATKTYADVPSFAFVEYESRRDADDAYHEMHNKRIGRDDLLKIEVRQHMAFNTFPDLTSSSGLEHPHLLHGVSTLAATALVTLEIVATAAATALLLDEVHAPHLLAAVTTLLAKMTAVIAMTIVETDHGALTTATGK